MRPMFHVTYEVVTPESAEEGDVAERGFAKPYGWHFPIDTVEPGAASCGLTLREAASMVGYVEDSGTWFSEVDGRANYQTGAETRYSIHPPRSITLASYTRLARLLRAA